MLLILVLGAACALEAGRRVRQRWRCDAFIADLKTFAVALEGARGTTGSALANRSGELPAALQRTNWGKGSPFGGRYEWSALAAGSGLTQSAVIVTAFAPDFPLEVSRADLLYIDRTIDDGNLTTGRFRAGFNGWPVYQLGPKG